MVKRLLTAFAAVSSLALAGCGGDDMSNMDMSTSSTVAVTSSTATPSGSTASTEAGAKSVDVDISGFNFSPATVTITAGTTVTWKNNDSVVHTVTSGGNRTADGKFDKSLSPGDTFSFTFDTAGTYAYYCKPHVNMVASVIVQ